MATNNIIYSLQNFEPMTVIELQKELFSNYENGFVSDAVLVQLIELASGYLNLKTKINYAKSNNISYNGAKKRNTRSCVIDGITFIIDND
jgi:hypothetical protein